MKTQRKSHLRPTTSFAASAQGWAPAFALSVLAGTAMGQSTEPFPAAFELSSLNGSNGFVLNGIDVGDRSGSSVSSAGDVNGDGVDDLLIGAILADPNGKSYAGESYVVFGAPGVGAGGSIELSSLNGSNGFVLNGIDANDFSGRTISSAGDVNGDGVDDLIIGANQADPNGNSAAGEIYVIFGAPDVGAGGSFELSSLNGSNGFVLNGIDLADRSGSSVSSAGDVNGDGVDDLIIGAYQADPNGIDRAGETYVVFGAPGVGAGGSIELSSLNGANGFVLNGIDAVDRSGLSVSSAGDVNGDGVDDLIIGADIADPNGVTDAGESYVVFGALGVGAGGSIELSMLNGTNGFVLNGIDAADQSGFSVSSAGDVNGDGVDDLMIGANQANPNGIDRAGETYVVFGAPGVGAGGSIELSSLNGANGFVLNGIDVLDESGRSVSSAGDVNGDGIDDLIIGASGAVPNGIGGAGESYVVFGRANGQRWTSPAGGEWDSGANWREGVSPQIGIVTIDTPIGVTVTGPVGAVFLDALNLGAGLGQTRLDLPSGSLVSVSENDLIIPPSAAVSGAGVLVSERLLFNQGLIELDGLSVLTPDFIINNSGGTIRAGLGLLQGDFINEGTVDLAAYAEPGGFAGLSILGPTQNYASGRFLLRNGAVELELDGTFQNAGDVSIAFAEASILGDISNITTGLISISGASSALVTGDINNATTIILTDDSSLVVLGSIIGNGVSGPGGAGTAGSVYVEDGIIPGILGNPFGTARFDGDLDLGLSAHTVIEVGGTSPGVDLDQIAAQHLGIGGTLQVVLANGYAPQPGDVYQVLDFASLSGSFSSVVLDPGLIAAGADTTDLLVNGRS